MAAKTILANKTAGTSAPTACTISDILDFVTSTRGSIIYRGAGGWAALAPGTAGFLLQTNGAGADPTWVTAPAGGGGGGSTPTIRSVTALQSSSWTTFNVPLPAGTIAGDVVIVFMENGFNSGAIPAGWVQIASMNNGFTNGYTIGKVVTAGDVAAGTVTVSATGAFNGVTCAVCLTGTTVQSISLVTSFGSSSSTSFASAPINGLAGASSIDMLIGMVATRGTMSVTLSSGLTSLSSVNGTSASAQLFKVNAAAIGKLGVSETATFPAGNNGYVFSMMSFKGP